MTRREFFLALTGQVPLVVESRGCPGPASQRVAPAYMIAALCREDKEQLNRIEAFVKLIVKSTR